MLVPIAQVGWYRDTQGIVSQCQCQETVASQAIAIDLGFIVVVSIAIALDTNCCFSIVIAKHIASSVGIAIVINKTNSQISNAIHHMRQQHQQQQQQQQR
jgi:hypothetical protein